LRRQGHAFLRGADQAAPYVALGHAIGRLGCFANGCCYGIVSSSKFAVRFPGHPTPVLPTQLLESFGLAILFLGLYTAQRPAVLAKPGLLFGLYLVGYGILRYGLEWWRANQPIVVPGWTLHQVLSAVAVVVGLWLAGRRLGPTRAGRV